MSSLTSFLFVSSVRDQKEIRRIMREYPCIAYCMSSTWVFMQAIHLNAILAFPWSRQCFVTVPSPLPPSAWGIAEHRPAIKHKDLTAVRALRINEPSAPSLHIKAETLNPGSLSWEPQGTFVWIFSADLKLGQNSKTAVDPLSCFFMPILLDKTKFGTRKWSSSTVCGDSLVEWRKRRHLRRSNESLKLLCYTWVSQLDADVMSCTCMKWSFRMRKDFFSRVLSILDFRGRCPSGVLEFERRQEHRNETEEAMSWVHVVVTITAKSWRPMSKNHHMCSRYLS